MLKLFACLFLLFVLAYVMFIITVIAMHLGRIANVLEDERYCYKGGRGGE